MKGQKSFQNMIFDDGKLHIFIITITFSKMALVGFLKKVHFPLQILNFRLIGRCHLYYAVLCAHVGRCHSHYATPHPIYRGINEKRDLNKSNKEQINSWVRLQ